MRMYIHAALQIIMVKVVNPTTFVPTISVMVRVFKNRRPLLAFVFVLAVCFVAIVYVIACNAARSQTWREQLRSGSLIVASELTRGQLAVFYSKHRRARQKPIQSTKAAEEGNNSESRTLSTAIEQQMSVNRKKVSVWDLQDREWRVLDDVIKSILRARDEEQWSMPTHRLQWELQNLNNRTSVRQLYVYPLLREYLVRHSNWIPPKPGEGSDLQLHTDRKKLCMDDFCLSQLLPSDEKLHFLCLQRSLEYVVKTDILQNEKSEDDILSGMRCSCKLLKVNKKAPRKRVALSSLPGSGNTWVRQLLESATGICTGSMWCDPSLRANHFCGEGQHSRSLLVIKDHSTKVAWSSDRKEERDAPQRKPDYDAMILVHRDPFDATVAEWNRALFDKEQNSSHGKNMHVASYGPEMFGKAKIYCEQKPQN